MFSLEDNANCNLSKRETPMLHLSRLPQNVSYFLRGTQHFFRFRHHLVFSWTLILLLVYQDKATLLDPHWARSLGLQRPYGQYGGSTSSRGQPEASACLSRPKLDQQRCRERPSR